jgi:metal dependent enzyme
MPKKITDLAVGGQAVIEGVMMRDAHRTATAVRLPNGEIDVETRTVSSIRDRYPVLNLPLIRGSVIMVESLIIGMRALSFSAQAAGEEDEQMTKKEIAMTILFALVLASILFIVIPTGAAHLAAAYTDDPIVFNLIEGGIRLMVFLLYIWGISFMGGIRRVFQYHGAEHKTIHCYEAGEALTVENVQKFPRLHPRCGTNFLLIVMVVAIVFHVFFGWPDLWLRILSRLAILPVVAGVSYEIIRFAGRSENHLVHILITPGLWLQYLTTRPPADEMVEVAIESLKAVLPAEDIPAGSGNYRNEQKETMC